MLADHAVAPDLRIAGPRKCGEEEKVKTAWFKWYPNTTSPDVDLPNVLLRTGRDDLALSLAYHKKTTSFYGCREIVVFKAHMRLEESVDNSNKCLTCNDKSHGR